MYNFVALKDLVNVFSFSKDYVWLDKTFSGASIDSRKCEKNNLFVAVKGENSDGHDFIKNAIDNGATVCLVSKNYDKANILKFYNQGVSFLVCDDTLKTLQDISAWYLSLIKNLIKIGITGSSGKTTTKNFIVEVLKQQYKVSYNSGNLNSEIGLPLVALSVDKNSDIAVFEMGINRIGEMDILADIVKPNLCVITNIETAHIGMFGSQEKIALEKGKICKYLSSINKCFINHNNKFTSTLSKIYGDKFVQFSSVVFSSIKDNGLVGCQLSLNDLSFNLNFSGEHNIEDAAVAVLVGREFNIDDKKIANALSSLVPTEGRGKIINGFCTVLEDCYNANPNSVEKSLKAFDDLKIDSRKVVVLGAMKELGDLSRDLHKEVGENILKSNLENIFLLGEDTSVIFDLCKGKKNIFYYDNFEELKNGVKNFVKNNDYVLLKGSRFFALERLTDILI